MAYKPLAERYFSWLRPEHFDVGGVRQEGTEIVRSLLADQAASIKFRGCSHFTASEGTADSGPSLDTQSTELKTARARDEIGAWRRHYNAERPHSALGYLSPMEFLSTTAAPSLEPLAGSAPALITQPQPENSSSTRS
ncbi:transposase [Rhodobacteraceae bacterium 2CG4]|uniref:Transposase n=1 Tax=Halovulum marinum TaxID=2662447 RepID=A0A6L5Z1Y6_9RHOB|nr:transposase [Halovulum marinum]